MRHSTDTKTRQRNGFSLLEILITLTIIGILATLSTLAYRGHRLHARRNEAIRTLLSMQLSQARYHLIHRRYGSIEEIWNNILTTPTGNYVLEIMQISNSGYTLIATAQGDQTTDKQGKVSCGVLQLTYYNGDTTYSPSSCWKP